MESLTFSRKAKLKVSREHDYVFDNLFLVSGEKDYNKAVKKAAAVTAEPIILPVYKSMFSELPHYNSYEICWHTNPRLPSHVDCSYREERYFTDNTTPANVDGKDRFRYFATPKTTVSATTAATVPETEILNVEENIVKNIHSRVSKLTDKAVQTIYRESSAQTVPYEPDYTISEECRQTPEVLKLEDIRIDPEQGIRLDMVEKLKRLRIRRSWLESGANLKILKMLEETEQRYREIELDREIKEKGTAKLETKVNTSRPEKIWTAAKDRLKRCSTAIEHKKEREMRKIEAKQEEFNKNVEQLVKGKSAPRLPSSTVPKSLNMTLNTNFTPNYEAMKRHTSDLGQKMKAKINRCTRKHRMHQKRVLEFEEQLILQNEGDKKSSEETLKETKSTTDETHKYNPFCGENLDSIVSALIDNVIISLSENDKEDDSEGSD